MFVGKFAGTSAWERHPQGDEIVQILEGAATLHLMTEEGRQSVILKEGTMVIVPRNIWHQFEAPDGVSVMTTTPQPTEHLTVDVADPRTAA
jgi:quercetin dioxygenase-like cupin family protein